MKNDCKNNVMLRDQYEDSLFAILMDEFAFSEGQRLIEENEKLGKDETFKLPDGFESRCEKAIYNTFAEKKRKESVVKAKRALSRVALVFLACGMVFTALFSTVSAFRESVYRLVTQGDSVNTDTKIREDEFENSVQGNGGDNVIVPSGAYLPTWLPIGYEVYSYNSSNNEIIAVYKNKDNNEIRFFEYAKEQVLGVDTENAESSESVKINEFDGILILKENRISITWADTQRQKLIRIKATDIDKETAIRIAESVNIY